MKYCHGMYFIFTRNTNNKIMWRLLRLSCMHLFYVCIINMRKIQHCECDLTHLNASAITYVLYRGIVSQRKLNLKKMTTIKTQTAFKFNS